PQIVKNTVTDIQDDLGYHHTGPLGGQRGLPKISGIKFSANGPYQFFGGSQLRRQLADNAQHLTVTAWNIPAGSVEYPGSLSQVFHTITKRGPANANHQGVQCRLVEDWHRGWLRGGFNQHLNTGPAHQQRPGRGHPLAKAIPVIFDLHPRLSDANDRQTRTSIVQTQSGFSAAACAPQNGLGKVLFNGAIDARPLRPQGSSGVIFLAVDAQGFVVVSTNQCLLIGVVVLR